MYQIIHFTKRSAAITTAVIIGILLFFMLVAFCTNHLATAIVMGIGAILCMIDMLFIPFCDE